MSVFKYADSLRDELTACLIPFQEAIVPLQKIEEDLEKTKSMNILELDALKVRVQNLEETIAKNEIDIDSIVERQEKLKSSETFFAIFIEEVNVMKLLDSEFIEEKRREIQETFFQLYPEGQQQKLEKVEISEKYALCSFQNLAQFTSSDWRVTTLNDLQKDWPNFSRLASNSGIVCLDSFKESNSLLHIHNGSGKLSYFSLSDGDCVSSHPPHQNHTVGERVIFLEHVTRRKLSSFLSPGFTVSRDVLSGGYLIALCKK